MPTHESLDVFILEDELAEAFSKASAILMHESTRTSNNSSYHFDLSDPSQPVHSFYNLLREELKEVLNENPNFNSELDIRDSKTGTPLKYNGRNFIRKTVKL